MKVFFDNCTSPIFAGCLGALIRPDGDEAHHVRFMPNYGFAHDTKDVDWIKQLGADNDVWIVVTGDHRIRKNLAERTAWIKAGLKAFVLAKAYQKTSVNQCALRRCCGAGPKCAPSSRPLRPAQCLSCRSTSVVALSRLR